MLGRRRSHVLLMLGAYAVSIGAYPWIPPISLLPGRLFPLGRPLIAFLLPTTALLLYVLLGSLWTRDVVRTKSTDAEITYDAIVSRIALFVMALHLVIVCGLLSVAGIIPPMIGLLARVVPALLGLALIGVGNLMPRLRPNLVIGIRTTGALADAHTWARIHRVAGYVAVALGLVLIVVGGTMPPGGAVAPVVGAAGLAAVAVLFGYVSRAERMARHPRV